MDIIEEQRVGNVSKSNSRYFTIFATLMMGCIIFEKYQRPQGKQS